MPLEITFTLSDKDLSRFKTIACKMTAAVSDRQGEIEIEKAAYKIIEVAMSPGLPDFIAERLLQLRVLLAMIKDDEWDLDDRERRRILSAMSYFTNPIDLIPDHIPGIGFLDDAIFVEIIVRELRVEIDAYNNFCEFRDEKEAELTAQGKDLGEDREEWILSKREELLSEVNQTRSETDSEEYTFELL